MPLRKTARTTALILVLAGAASTAVIAGETVTYTYDALGRLKVVSSTGTVNDGQAYSYCYDAAGNRTLAKTNAAGVTADCQSVTPTPSPTPAPSISIGDTSVAEGSSLLFSVTLSAAHSSAISVDYATAYGSAGANDFTATSGTLTFNAGETSKAFAVSTIQDTLIESNETFTVNLSSPTGGATISDGQGIGTIFDDDEFEDPMCGGLPC